VGAVLASLACAVGFGWAPAGAQLASSAAHRTLTAADAVRAARLTDPDFRAARHERDAARQDGPIARAGLLPNISLNARYADVGGWRDFGGGGVDGPREDLDYRSNGYGVSARQALYDPEAGANARVGEAQVAQAEASFAERETQLLLRVAITYLDVALAHGDVVLARSQTRAFTAQQHAARRRFELGDGTRTDVADAESRLQTAVANEVDAGVALQIARRVLEQVTGEPSADTPRLRIDQEGPSGEPASETRWRELALERNPAVRAQREAQRAAGFAVDRARGARLPKLDLVASLNRATSDSVPTLNQDTLQRVAGLQVSLPLFVGGELQARERQAASRHERERASVEAVVNAVLLDVRRHFAAVEGSVAKLAALRRAAASAEVAARGADAGFRAGTRSFWEVLEAQRRQFVAERDLTRAMRDALVAQISLQAAAGVLDDAAVASLDGYFR